MKSAHRVGLLSALIVATVAAHLAIDMRTHFAPQGPVRPALAPAVERAAWLSVVRRGEPETRLVRGMEGVWQMRAPYVADVDSRVVLRLTDVLAFAPIVDETTEAELLRLGRTRADFGLEEPQCVVAMGGTDGSVAATIAFGASTPAGDGVYASVGNSDAVYVVSSNVLAAVGLTAADFRRRRVVALEPGDIAAFDVKDKTGRLVRLVRDDQMWKILEPREGMASSARVRAFLEATTHLEAREFVWPTSATNETAVLSDARLAGYGFLSDEAVTVTLKGVNGQDVAVSFGSAADKGLVYVRAPNGSVVTVSAASRDVAVASMEAFVDSRLFPMEAKAVNVLSIDEGGTRHLLSRDAEGAWRMEAPVSAPADAKAVANLIDRLLALRLSDGATVGVRVSVGTNSEPVSVSRAKLMGEARLEDLRSKEIVRIDPKRIKRVAIADHDGKPVSVLFDADRGHWVVEEGLDGAVVADEKAATRLAEALHPLKAIRVVRLKVAVSELGLFGLDKPQRTVAVDQTAEGAVRRNILIGDVTDGGRYATLGSSDAVFVIPPECADALLAPLVK